MFFYYYNTLISKTIFFKYKNIFLSFAELKKIKKQLKYNKKIKNKKTSETTIKKQ